MNERVYAYMLYQYVQRLKKQKQMKKIIFALPGNELLAKQLATKSGCELGSIVIRNFPDGETYVKINSDIKNKKIIFVCTLNNPDNKIMALYFLAKTAKELGAKQITIIAPYLAYMRQDKSFNAGECITSGHFASFISTFADELITIDPHLHRINSLSEIFKIPTKVLHANDLVSNWIKKNISSPVLIGPDSESEQWVSEIANKANAPFLILTKNRKGDTDVEVSNPDLAKYKNYTPVLVDDIISTAHTMIETINHLKLQNMNPAICIGVHAVFSGNAYHELKNTGTKKIVTCNTILHETNEIDITELLSNSF